MVRMRAIANKGYPEYKPTSKFPAVILLAGNTGNKETDFKFNFFGQGREIFLTDLQDN